MFKHGVYTALVTPFTKDSTSIDILSFEKLLHKQIEAKVSGILLFGTTGEFPTVEFQERETLLRIAVKAAGTKIPIMAGISTSDVKTAIMLAKQAKVLGAHAIQVTTPPYNRPTQEGLYQYYKAISEAVDLPLFIYNIPYRTSVSIEKNTMKRLFSLPTVRGFKNSSDSLSSLYDVLEASHESSSKLLILTGDDTWTVPAIASGAQGVMSVVSNFAPHTTKTLVDSALQGDFETARTLFFKIKPLIEGCFIETNPMPIKCLLYQKGLIHSPSVRLPLVEPTPASQERLKALCNTYKELL